MILLASFEPVSTFELRPSNTTKTGGKTLLCPTPYTVRMALLDRLIRSNGVDEGRKQFSIIRDLGLAMKPPAAVAVNRTFQKILRPPLAVNKNTHRLEWTSTIAMREFCVHSGLLHIAFDCPADFASVLARTVPAINYFGQRGSFFQLVEFGEVETIPEGFVDVTQPTQTLQFGFLQRMDDMRPDATFDDVDVFNPRAKGGRRAYNVVFPYMLDHHGFNHSIWRWQGA